MELAVLQLQQTLLPTLDFLIYHTVYGDDAA